MGTRQHGFGIVTIIVYLAVAAAAVGLVWWVYHQIDTTWATTAGIERGKKDKDAEYAARDNEALRKAVARVKELEDAAREKERAHAEELGKIAAQRAKEKRDAKSQNDRDRAAVAAGALRLRDPNAAPGAALCPGGPGPSPGTAAGGRDGATGADLSVEASGFLLGLANEADDVARQLAAAQAVIRAQIKTCNEGR